MSKPVTRALVLAAAVATAAVAVPGAVAKDGNGIRVIGKCSAGVSSKLKVSAEDGGLEVEFEVDQNRNGIPWRVTLRRNGTLVAATTVKTHAPSGSFSLRRVITGTAGADRIVAVAKRPSGATCTAVATF